MRATVTIPAAPPKENEEAAGAADVAGVDPNDVALPNAGAAPAAGAAAPNAEVPPNDGAAELPPKEKPPAAGAVEAPKPPEEAGVLPKPPNDI